MTLAEAAVADDGLSTLLALLGTATRSLSGHDVLVLILWRACWGEGEVTVRDEKRRGSEQIGGSGRGTVSRNKRQRCRC